MPEETETLVHFYIKCYTGQASMLSAFSAGAHSQFHRSLLHELAASTGVQRWHAYRNGDISRLLGDSIVVYYCLK